MKTLIAVAITVLAIAPIGAAAQAPREMEKVALWRNEDGPHLRGAAISQRLRDPEVDGDGDFLGRGPVGVPYTQADFDKLARLGANLVVFSHPGLFQEKPPYERVQPEAQANLDRLLAMALKADLFAVIAFRSGPGRSPFTFHVGQGGTWFSPDKFNDAVWADPAAQDAWVSMWRYTAERYRGHPAVVGYQLMVEPNSSHVGSDARTGRLDIFDAKQFHTRYGGTRYDWNRLYPRIVAAVRSVDPDTPILIGGNGYSSISFMQYLKPTGDRRSVYVAHNYAPWQYTHQEPGEGPAYPGWFDVDYDQRPDRIDADYVATLFDRVAAFGRRHGVPVAVAEFGVARWAPGAAAFLEDSFAAMEARGIGSVLWHWPSSHRPYESQQNTHNYLFGPDPDSTADVRNSAMADVIRSYWSRNRLRPSVVRFVRSGD